MNPEQRQRSPDHRPIPDTQSPLPEAGDSSLEDVSTKTLEMPPEETEGEGLDEHQEQARTSYEERLASKLMNPELTAVKELKINISYVAVKTINKIERVAHAGRDVYDFVKGAGLKARKNHAQRKYDRLERKASSSLFGFNRKKFEKKAAFQKKVLSKHDKGYQSHVSSIGNRHVRREEAIHGRKVAQGERYFALLDRVEDAHLRKAERRKRNLERMERLPLDPGRRRQLKERKEYLIPAINQSWRSR